MVTYKEGWMKISINFGEISPKYRVLVVMEAKWGVEMSEGRNIQKNWRVSLKFRHFLINRQSKENISGC